MEEFLDIPITITSELDRIVAEGFLVFDFNGSKFVDNSDIGNVLRFLDLVPLESDIEHIINTCEFKDLPGCVHLSKFLPIVQELLANDRMVPATPMELLNAFRILDPPGRGFVEYEYFVQLMKEKGEAFSEENLKEMLRMACDRNEDYNIVYEPYIRKIWAKDKHGLVSKAKEIEEARRLAAQPKDMFARFGNR